MCVVPPFGTTYIGESAKAYGLKVRCLHGEHVGEHVVNLVGEHVWNPLETSREHCGNTLGNREN